MLRRVSSQTGIGLRKLQDWRSMGWALVSAALAGGFAWLFTHYLMPSASPFLRAAAGGVCLLVVYAVLNLTKLA